MNSKKAKMVQNKQNNTKQEKKASFNRIKNDSEFQISIYKTAGFNWIVMFF